MVWRRTEPRGRRRPLRLLRQLRGAAGSSGDVEYEEISLEVWNAALTAPYLVSAAPTTAAIGETIVFSTENVSGSAELVFSDDLDASRSVADQTLTENGDGTYTWVVPDDFTASRYTVQIRRLYDNNETNIYAIEVDAIVDEVYFTDLYDARPGGTAYVLGRGLRTDSQIYYDGTPVDTTDSCDSTSCAIDGRDWLSFTIPVTATDDTYFVRTDATTEHEVYLDQTYPLDDTNTVSFTLKQSYGLTFRPSSNGYDFSNHDMTVAAKDEANDDIWQAFRDTYGAAEIDWELAEAIITIGAHAVAGDVVGALTAALGESADLVLSFIAFAAFWDPDTDSANCTGMSTVALYDYFSGVSTLDDLVETDVAHDVMVTQSHILSEELLGMWVSDMLSPVATTEATIESIIDFFANGSSDPAADAPVIFMIPEFTNVSVQTVSDSHTLAPYMVVYADPSDAWPSRIYFYDSNAPERDDVYMEISQDGGDLEFDFDMLDTDPSDPYRYSSDDGWVLSSATLDYVLSDVDLPFSFLDWLL